jgi:hypothetical protein
MTGISTSLRNWRTRVQKEQQPLHTERESDVDSDKRTNTSGSTLSTNRSLSRMQSLEERVKYLQLLVNYGDEAAMEELLETKTALRQAT